MNSNTIYWYDFETFGADPRRDRAAQFAGIRTDEELNPVSDPLVLYCRPANDFLPSPEACLVTGITPQLAQQKGVDEASFIGQIHEQFAQPRTCVAGYNSIRFDDELTRQLLYRNFYDPYAREYKDGNSRWDIIDMIRLCAAVRPDGICWPVNEQGNRVYKLEELTAANGISHGDAHDALSDVMATIEMARLVKQSQPRLYDYVYQLRLKKNVEQHLDLFQKKPVVHVSSMYPASNGCLAVVAPLCRHPQDKNGVVVYDLRDDPDSWLSATPDEIKQRVFNRADQLPAGVNRIPLKTLHVNRCPIVAPLSILTEQQARAMQIDLEACNRHWQRLLEVTDLTARLHKALAPEPGGIEDDPDFMIYSGGFFNEGDRKLMDVVRASGPQQLAMLNLPFRDRRLPEMLFRYRARNYPQTLDADEQNRWEKFRQTRLGGQQRIEFEESLEAARADCNDEDCALLLRKLREYVDEVVLPTN